MKNSIYFKLAVLIGMLAFAFPSHAQTKNKVDLEKRYDLKPRELPADGAKPISKKPASVSDEKDAAPTAERGSTTPYRRTVSTGFTF